MARKHHGLFGECDQCGFEKDLSKCHECVAALCDACMTYHWEGYYDFGGDDEQ